jgi:transcriptional regulator
MYIPKHFEEQRVDVMHELIRTRPLATVVTQSAIGLSADHIPLLVSESPGPFGTLRGHVARANPIVARLAGGSDALAVFHGPDAYVTPSWYATKLETGKVVPTWNYVAVHAYGVLRLVEDPAWLRDLLDRLTAHNEAKFAAPWSVADAPADYIDKSMKAIVGIEMVITRLTGKWKVSQNQSAPNRAGVVEGLKASGGRDASEMASLVESRAKTPGP